MSARLESRARDRAKRKRNERGIALVMVLGAVAVLTVMLAEFQEETSAELASALADRDLVQGEYFAKSAVNLARLLIASEPTIRTAIAPLFMLMKRTPRRFRCGSSPIASSGRSMTKTRRGSSPSTPGSTCRSRKTSA